METQEAQPVLAAIAFTLLEVKSAECRVACGFVGYDDGRFESPHCLCIDRKEYEEITRRKRIILKARRSRENPAPIEDFTHPWVEPPPKSD
jgi:hypothetical protein